MRLVMRLCVLICCGSLGVLCEGTPGGHGVVLLVLCGARQRRVLAALKKRSCDGLGLVL